MSPIELGLSTEFANGFCLDKPYKPLRRHGKVSFDWTDTDKSFQVRAWGEIFPEDEDFRGTLKLSQEELYSAVSDCRAQWQASVIELEQRDPRGKKDLVFRQRLDMTGKEDRNLVHKAGLDVARAGRGLFDLVFNSGDAGLRLIGEVLEAGLRKRECNLVFISSDCYVPWRMLYTPPDPATDLWAAGAAFEMEGFWGNRHIIEHKPKSRPCVIAQIALEEGRLKTALAVDRNIDLLERFVAPIEEFFKANPATDEDLRVFEKKLDLRNSLAAPTYPDHLLYFGCHGVVSGDAVEPSTIDSRLTLTDGQPIKGIHLRTWFAKKGMTTSPVVFINACQGGQMTSLFYRSFADVLLKSGAHCLIGTQCDLPTIFAADFAEKFFTAFLAGEQRIGVIMRDLTRDYSQNLNNPLGLIYSQYYGLDTHLKLEADGGNDA